MRHGCERGLDAGEQCLVVVDGVTCAEVDDRIGEVGQDPLDGVGFEGLPVGEAPKGAILLDAPLLLGQVIADLEVVAPANKIEGDVPAPRPLCQDFRHAGLACSDRPNQHNLRHPCPNPVSSLEA